MSQEKELAYRYDLFITPDWRDRFDSLVDEKIELPLEGRILDVNCGTGAHTIELAARARNNAEVTGIDSSLERIRLARAKAQVKKIEAVTFQQGSASALPFADEKFDAVLGDASMLPVSEIEKALIEMTRVAQPGARVILKLATYGSFDEFFSIYWEALLATELLEEVWSNLEAIIQKRLTITQAKDLAARAGLDEVESFSSKEEFFYDTATDFIEAPLIQDGFLDEWLSIVPPQHRQKVRDKIVSVIERERHDAPFDISIKATLISGVK